MKHKPREASPCAQEISSYVALMDAILGNNPDMTSKDLGCFNEHINAIF